MTYTTTVKRRMAGDLCAETLIPMHGRRELHITTFKRSNGGVTSAAQCVEVSADRRTTSFAIFSDYRRTLAHDPKMRATEKNIRALHEQALKLADEALAEAKAKHPETTQEAA